jgi:hypothetical protein
VDDGQLFAELAERLRVAHVRVAALNVSGTEKLSISRHLRVISDAAKHDLRRASERLDAFLADLDDRFPPHLEDD